MEAGLEKAGAETLHGKVRFVNDTTLEFEDGRRIEARRFFIAAGAKPLPMDVPGAALMADSSDFLDLPELPCRVLFVGGGYVSFEFAHIAARAGAEVTIIDRGARPHKAFDPDLVDLLLECNRAIGIPTHRDLMHRVPLELVAVIACPHVSLLASKLGGKASTNLGAPQGLGHAGRWSGACSRLKDRNRPLRPSVPTPAHRRDVERGVKGAKGGVDPNCGIRHR